MRLVRTLHLQGQILHLHGWDRQEVDGRAWRRGADGGRCVGAPGFPAGPPAARRCVPDHSDGGMVGVSRIAGYVACYRN